MNTIMGQIASKMPLLVAFYKLAAFRLVSPLIIISRKASFTALFNSCKTMSCNGNLISIKTASAIATKSNKRPVWFVNTYTYDRIAEKGNGFATLEALPPFEQLEQGHAYYRLGFSQHFHPCFTELANVWVDSTVDAWLYSFWHRRLHENTLDLTYDILQWILQAAEAQELSEDERYEFTWWVF